MSEYFSGMSEQCHAMPTFSGIMRVACFGTTLAGPPEQAAKSCIWLQEGPCCDHQQQSIVVGIRLAGHVSLCFWQCGHRPAISMYDSLS